MEKNKMERMKELVKILNKAARVYYQGTDEIMSNLEYDQLYDELAMLERESGTVLAGSPTGKVGYEVVSELPKENHAAPMLSLDKTKEVETLREWLGEQKGLLSWKLDGLTIVLTYENGNLVKAVTRGNGLVGEVVTGNAKMFSNLPLAIAYKGRLVLRGEAVIHYSDFEKINREIEEEATKYKNPRNLCSGSVRQLNNEITKRRNVHFYAFALVQAEGVDFRNSRKAQMEWLASQGFDVVFYKEVTAENIADTVQFFAGNVAQTDTPSDGLVLLLDDIAYGEALGVTAKFPRNAIAFKWADEEAETILKEVEWSASRTGLINPVAIFEPVELEGTTVSRASVHNISIIRQLQLGIGDTVKVYKANMIIPQISENLTKKGGLPIPERCPVCGGATEIRRETGVETLYCINEDCLAKKIKSLTHFVSRDAMNIEGLSEATIEKFIAQGIVKELADFFRLEAHRDKITTMEGFGEKSFENMLSAAERARKVELPNFIYSLGILNIGLSNAKVICRSFAYDFQKIRTASAEELVEVPGIGEIIAKSLVEYFAEEENRHIVDDLLKEVELVLPDGTEAGEQKLTGITFVITGSLEQFANRNALKRYIEEQGGKVTGSVTSKTDYLINNDNLSASSKNKKAKELGIPVMTEMEFIRQYGGIH